MVIDLDLAGIYVTGTEMITTFVISRVIIVNLLKLNVKIFF